MFQEKIRDTGGALFVNAGLFAMKLSVAALFLTVFCLPVLSQEIDGLPGVHHAVIEAQGMPPSAYVDLEGSRLDLNGNTVFRTPRVSFQAKRPILSGRLYAEVAAPASVGVAFSNPNVQSVTVSFYFTDSSGTDRGAGAFTIGPNAQIARFLHEPPFNAPIGLTGSFTFSASAPVAAIAVLGLVNDRGIFMMPQVPVIDIDDTGTPVVPYFAVGQTVTTDVVLVNMRNERAAGTFSFVGQGSSMLPAQPVEVTISEQNGTEFPYDIPPRSSRRFATQPRATTLRNGSIRVNAATGDPTPAAFAVVSNTDTLIFNQQTIPGQRPATALRVMVQGDTTAFGGYATETRVFIVNPSPTPVSVTLSMTSRPGQVFRTVPAQGQLETYPPELFNIPEYRGMLRISSSSPVAAVGIWRDIRNATGEFVREAFDDAVPPFPQPVLPHLVSSGYTTWITLVNTADSQASSGTIRFFSQTSDPIFTKSQNSLR
jgi:hypothetical protein